MIRYRTIKSRFAKWTAVRTPRVDTIRRQSSRSSHSLSALPGLAGAVALTYGATLRAKVFYLLASEEPTRSSVFSIIAV